MVLLVAGALAWFFVGLGGPRANPVAILLGRDSFLARLVYILVGLAAVAVVFQRDFYLPFLGPTLAPCAALEDRAPPGATMEVEIQAEPGAKVLYWASEPASESLKNLQTWKEAYARYENAGVATADFYGKALLRVRQPQPYTVPFKGRLDPHVHYRVCAPAGWMGRVETAWIRGEFRGTY